MAEEMPTANWPIIFEELPIAIQQLRAHGLAEAAILLGGARGILLSVDETYGYEELVHCLGHVARVALDSDNNTDAASVEASRFLQRVDAAFDLYIEARQNALVGMLAAA